MGVLSPLHFRPDFRPPRPVEFRPRSSGPMCERRGGLSGVASLPWCGPVVASVGDGVGRRYVAPPMSAVSVGSIGIDRVGDGVPCAVVAHMRVCTFACGCGPAAMLRAAGAVARAVARGASRARSFSRWGDEVRRRGGEEVLEALLEEVCQEIRISS